MILIVDDQSDSAEVLVKLLRREGRDAEAVTNGEAALQRACSARLTLIILDVMMPGMDGIQTLRAFKQHPKCRDVPIVMYSADYTAARAKEAHENGAADYVIKGVARWPDFLAIIARHAGAT